MEVPSGGEPESAEEVNIFEMTRRIMEGPIPAERNERINTLLLLHHVEVHLPFYLYVVPATPDEQEKFRQKEREIRAMCDSLSDDQIAAQILSQRQNIVTEAKRQARRSGFPSS